MENILNYLLDQPGVLAVQLTGSRLCGYEQTSSDVDLIVYVDGQTQWSLKTSFLLSNSLRCHCGLDAVEHIIPEPDVVDSWKLFGSVLLPRLTPDHIWAKTPKGKSFVTALMQSRETIGKIASKTFLARYAKIYEKLQQNEHICTPSKLIFNILYTAHALNFISVDPAQLVAFKHGKLSLSSLYQEIEFIEPEVTYNKEDMYDVIHTFNKSFYTDFKKLTTKEISL